MAERFENPDVQEATEAKLCAYLEGELSASERTDIEKYLQGNPQHRQLLKELAKTRGLVGMLPRERAPTEIAEAFEGQIERAMLLDGPGNELLVGTNRWPQRMLVAAILLLAVGLGVVVYLALPGGGTTPIKISALSGPLGDRGPAPMAAVSPATRAISDMPMPSTPQAAPMDSAAPTTQALTSAVTTDKDKEVLEAANRYRDIAVAGKKAGPQVNPTMYMTVATADPAAAEQQVRSFFQNRGVVVTTNAPGKAADGAVNIDDVAAANAPTANAPTLKNAMQNYQNQQANFAATQQTQQVMGQVAPSAGKNPTAMTIFAPDVKPGDLSDLRTALVQVGTGQIVETMAASGGPANSETPVLGISRATEMTAKASGFQPTTQDTGIIGKGQMLNVTVDQLVGAGLDKTSRVQVDDGGNVSLPMMIEPVPAAGQTTDQLEKNIAAKYREANLIPSATVRVEMAGPTTQQSDAKVAATTQMADQPVNVVLVVNGLTAGENALPTTHPATLPTTEPIFPAAPPATQP